MLIRLYLQYDVQSPTGAPISGENLHIGKGRDKLRELSRVPTVYQYGMQSECPIHTILKYFSFLAFQNCSLPCIWIYFIPTHSLFYKNSFLSGFLYTHTHTKMYDHSPQKHLINIQVMPLSPQSTTFRGGLFSQGLWPMYILRLEGSHNHLWGNKYQYASGKDRPIRPAGTCG